MPGVWRIGQPFPVVRKPRFALFLPLGLPLAIRRRCLAARAVGVSVQGVDCTEPRATASGEELIVDNTISGSVRDEKGQPLTGTTGRLD